MALHVQRLAAGAGAALDGRLVVRDSQEVIGLVGDAVGPDDVDRRLDPGAPVFPGLRDQFRRRLDDHQQHVDVARVAARDDVIGRVVDEGEAAVGFDDLGLDRIDVPVVDVGAVVLDPEADGNLAGVGDRLARDERGGGVGVGDVPQLDDERGAGREGEPLAVGDGAGDGGVPLATRGDLRGRVGRQRLPPAGGREQHDQEAEEETHGALDSGPPGGSLGDAHPIRLHQYERSRADRGSP